MTTFFGVVVACSKNRTDAKWKVRKISVEKTASPRAKIDCCRCPNTVVEVSVKLAIMVQKFIEMVYIVLMKEYFTLPHLT
jgi:hypothetical protein